jgi:NurA-like 5'-3' nuclease
MILSRFVLIVFLTVPLLSQSADSLTAIDPIEKRWAMFIEAIEEEDAAILESLIADSIDCYLCIENTPAEVQEVSSIRDSDPNWFSKIFDELIWTSKSRFLKEDIWIIFDAKMLGLIKTPQKVRFSRQFDNTTIYEVLVTIQKPTYLDEGLQYAFRFRLTDDGYRLNRVLTIP